jgi:hypothetical protein
VPYVWGTVDVDGLSTFVVDVALGWVLLLFIAFMAAALACTGFVNSIYLSSISSSVSVSSTMVASGGVVVVWVLIATFAVGVFCGPS